MLEDLPTNPQLVDQSTFFERFSHTRKVLKKHLRSRTFHDEVGSSNTEIPVMSVMVITYNHEKFIAQALDSILNQNFDQKIEINVMDDASTDNTQKIVEEYKARFPDIVNCYFNDKNVGKKATQINTYRGFQTLRGKYFALLEGDDYWTDENKLAKQFRFLESNSDYVACAHNTEKVFEDGSPSEHFLPVKGFGKSIAELEDLVYLNAVFHLSSVVYRNIFGPNPPYCFVDPYSCEATINMIYGLFGKFYCFDDYMSGYRVHSGGEFSSRSREDIWLFHIHGFRRFFLYMGPRHYPLVARATIKFSKYVLDAPANGVVDTLSRPAKKVFRTHLFLFYPLALVRGIKIFSFRFKKDPYVAISELTPLSLQLAVFRIESKLPILRKTRLVLKYRHLGPYPE